MEIILFLSASSYVENLKTSFTDNTFIITNLVNVGQFNKVIEVVRLL